jgi:hypothetical protein
MERFLAIQRRTGGGIGKAVSFAGHWSYSKL